MAIHAGVVVLHRRQADDVVALGLRSSLHAAAREAEDLPPSLPALYDKVNRTEPALLRALVRGSAARLARDDRGGHRPSELPGYALRVLDGNHLPGSDKRLKPLRALRGAALPGLTLVVYDPDTGLAVDLWRGAEDAYGRRTDAARALLDGAAPGQVWVADRHFCVRTWLEGLVAAGSFLRGCASTATIPAFARKGSGRSAASCETGTLREQTITLEGSQIPGDASRSD